MIEAGQCMTFNWPTCKWRISPRIYTLKYIFDSLSAESA